MDLCLEFLKKQFVSRPDLMSKISLTLMDVCTRERNGEQVEKSVIKNVLRMLAALNVNRV